MATNRRGQSIVEYAIMIVVVVIALLAVNLYMKRGIQGRLRESTDQIGRQFDPETFNISWQSTSTGNTVSTENKAASGNTTSSITSGETVTRNEYEEFGNQVPTSKY